MYLMPPGSIMQPRRGFSLAGLGSYRPVRRRMSGPGQASVARRMRAMRLYGLGQEDDTTFDASASLPLDTTFSTSAPLTEMPLPSDYYGALETPTVPAQTYGTISAPNIAPTSTGAAMPSLTLPGAGVNVAPAAPAPSVLTSIMQALGIGAQAATSLTAAKPAAAAAPASGTGTLLLVGALVLGGALLLGSKR